MFTANKGIDMWRNLRIAKNDQSHSCEGGAICPLLTEIAVLSDHATRLIDNVQGISIPTRAAQTDERRLASLSLAE